MVLTSQYGETLAASSDCNLPRATWYKVQKLFATFAPGLEKKGLVSAKVLELMLHIVLILLDSFNIEFVLFVCRFLHHKLRWQNPRKEGKKHVSKSVPFRIIPKVGAPSPPNFQMKSMKSNFQTGFALTFRLRFDVT